MGMDFELSELSWVRSGGYNDEMARINLLFLLCRMQVRCQGGKM